MMIEIDPMTEEDVLEHLENVKGKICLLQGRLTPPNVEKLVKDGKMIKFFDQVRKNNINADIIIIIL